ncbi:hypothetical protein [Streptomyces sp. HUAS ZL42]
MILAPLTLTPDHGIPAPLLTEQELAEAPEPIRPPDLARLLDELDEA